MNEQTFNNNFPVCTPRVRLGDHDQITALSGLLGSEVAARKLLKQFGSVHAIARASDLELAAAGVNAKKIKVLRNAVSVGLMAFSAPVLGMRLSRASDVFQRFKATLCLAEVEEFWAIAMDVRNRVIGEIMIARGCLTGVDVHPRDVFRPLVKLGAASVIFCHNHPSGDPSPSVQDIELTERLRQVGVICGITVLDHVIVAGDQFVSLAERSWQ